MMTEVMFDIPSDETISIFIINEDCIKEKNSPEIIKLAEGEVRPQLKAKKPKKKKGVETA